MTLEEYIAAAYPGEPALLQVADLLDRAADLLDAPDRWTRGAEARDENGGVVSPADPAAVQWGAAGAIMRQWQASAALDGPRFLEDRALDALKFVTGTDAVWKFNDRIAHDYTDVVGALRQAAMEARLGAERWAGDEEAIL